MGLNQHLLTSSCHLHQKPPHSLSPPATPLCRGSCRTPRCPTCASGDVRRDHHSSDQAVQSTQKRPSSPPDPEAVQSTQNPVQKASPRRVQSKTTDEAYQESDLNPGPSLIMKKGFGPPTPSRERRVSEGPRIPRTLFETFVLFEVGESHF